MLYSMGMARPKKGEPKLGKNKPCEGCGKLVYKAPSQLLYKKTYCSKECRKLSSFSFPCQICGALVYTQPAQLKYRARSTCGPKCRRELARSRAEAKHGGLTAHQISRRLRYSVQAVEWRKAVFERDDYTCQFCGVRGTYLEADHIKPWAYFPELRFEISNGRTLCRKCHDGTKMSAKRMREIYGS